MTVNEALSILEVAATATSEDIQRAYRGLARVWHPDRFPNDPELQRKAQEKLKQINAAYETLTSAAFVSGHTETHRNNPTPSQATKSAPFPSQESNPKFPTSTKYGWWRLLASFSALLILFWLVVRFINDSGQAQRAKQGDSREPLKIAASQPVSPTTEYTSPSSGMKFTLIPAGEFMMGTSEAEAEDDLRDLSPTRAAELKEVFDRQQPQHLVRITKPFYMGVYEVTQGEFQKLLGRNTRYFEPRDSSDDTERNLDPSRRPIEYATWFDAVEFCNKLSEADGRPAYYQFIDIERNFEQSIKSASVTVVGGNGYRLPTEAEWEYACRANTTTQFHFGSTLNGDKANVDGTKPYGSTTKGVYLRRTTVVDDPNYPMNAFGLAQMHGNVWEWCEDVYDEKAYASRSGVTTNPLVTSGSIRRVMRGGSWGCVAGAVNSAYRVGANPDIIFGDHGFRVVRWVLP